MSKGTGWVEVDFAMSRIQGGLQWVVLREGHRVGRCGFCYGWDDVGCPMGGSQGVRVTQKRDLF